MNNTDFREYSLPAPAYEDVLAEYAQIAAALEFAASADDAIAAVERWDALRRRLISWSTLVYIRFQQDTRNEAYKRAREYRDELEPKLTNLAVAMKRRLLESPHRDALAKRFGSHPFDLWRCDIASFDPSIESHLVRQSQLEAKYTELLASAKFEFRGESLTLSQLAKFNEHPDRDVRHEADQLRWAWFGDNQDQLDELFGQLVRLRQTMAEQLGYDNFVDLGYRRMQRIGYDQADVERFRAQVRELVVPLATEIRRGQASRLGIEPLMYWDEGLHDPTGNPRPLGDDDWMIDRAGELFARLNADMHKFFLRIREEHLLDLKSRDGKGGGGFCEIVPSFGMPFIFANCNGTMQDVMVFTHEMGHAFQCYASHSQPLWEYIYTTCETCEIHSLSLEFLAGPQMELFFGEDAARYRLLHLKKSILFLPYGAAVDHFQHLVYAHPSASPNERAAMWQELERIYQPGLNWGDLAHPASGRRWQAQLHIYRLPFYYIDYALALTCAMQLWELAARDQPAAMNRYVQLCRRGGEAPFAELVKSAGLTSPFDEGCLQRVVEYARCQID